MPLNIRIPTERLGIAHGQTETFVKGNTLSRHSIFWKADIAVKRAASGPPFLVPANAPAAALPDQQPA